MPVLGIDHVQLPFSGGLQAQLRHFYTLSLGLKELQGWPGPTLRFALAGQRLDLVPSPDGQALQAPGHVALRVRNLPGLRAALLDAGYAVDETHPLPGHARLYVDDPAGNTLEVLEPLSEEVAS
ncbi:MAG: VOC family protein [Hydrogenophaga sp.]